MNELYFQSDPPYSIHQPPKRGAKYQPALVYDLLKKFAKWSTQTKLIYSYVQIHLTTYCSYTTSISKACCENFHIKGLRGHWKEPLCRKSPKILNIYNTKFLLRLNFTGQPPDCTPMIYSYKCIYKSYKCILNIWNQPNFTSIAIRKIRVLQCTVYTSTVLLVYRNWKQHEIV